MDIKKVPLSQFADWARASNPELTAIGSALIDNYTGKVIAMIDPHEGEGAEDTAIFLASARVIVLELVRRLSKIKSDDLE